MQTNKQFFNSLPSIEKAKVEQIVYGRLFIPYTINGFYIMGADKKEDDYKLFVIEKWNTPLILKINYKEVMLSELINEYESLTFDNEWKEQKAIKLFNNIGNLYKIKEV